MYALSNTGHKQAGAVMCYNYYEGEVGYHRLLFVAIG